METGRVYEFGPFRQDPAARTLKRQGAPVPITPKSFDTLLYLVSNAGRTVTREEIIKAVWPDTFVEEGNLNYNISQIRKALGDNEEGVRYVQTLPKQGYRFVATVTQVPSLTDAALVDKPRLRWAQWAAAITILASAAILASALVKNRTAKSAPTLTRLTSWSGLTISPALSNDGTLLAYASDREGEGSLHIWVQPVRGREPLRITNGPANDDSPSFSPDGREIAFRSERDGGGVYVVPVTGGDPKRLVPLGRRPRYSPDGRWIAYWIGTDTAVGLTQSRFPLPGSAKMYIIPSAGGTPQQLRPDFAAVSYPVWTPDSKHILFLGNRDPQLIYEPSDLRQAGADSVDWWVTPIEGGPAIPTGANAAFRAMGLASISQVPQQWTPDTLGVLVSPELDGAQNLWRVPVSRNDWKVSGVPQRLTFGTAMEAEASVAGNRIAFASLNANLNIWSIPIDPNRAAVSDVPQRLTQEVFDHIYPAISPDGQKVLYSSRRSGTRDLWMKDLATGEEKVLSTPPWSVFGSVFSPDGSKVAYRSIENHESVVSIVPLYGGSREKIAACPAMGGWSSDGRRLLCIGTDPARIYALDLEARHSIPFLNHATWTLWQPQFCADNRWILFNATSPGRSRIFVAPVRAQGLIPESDWIAITDGIWDDIPRWSPDGKTVYFISERDGYRCIWAQRLNSSKHPLGAAIPVFHAHEARRSLLDIQAGNLEISVARDKIVVNMNERSGNVWMMTVAGQQ